MNSGVKIRQLETTSARGTASRTPHRPAPQAALTRMRDWYSSLSRCTHSSRSRGPALVLRTGISDTARRVASSAILGPGALAAGSGVTGMHARGAAIFTSGGWGGPDRRDTSERAPLHCHAVTAAPRDQREKGCCRVASPAGGIGHSRPTGAFWLLSHTRRCSELTPGGLRGPCRCRGSQVGHLQNKRPPRSVPPPQGWDLCSQHLASPILAEAFPHWGGVRFEQVLVRWPSSFDSFLPPRHPEH